VDCPGSLAAGARPRTAEVNGGRKTAFASPLPTGWGGAAGVTHCWTSPQESNSFARFVAVFAIPVFDQQGITSQQYNVLRILRGAGLGGPTLDIAERMIEQAPGITRLLDRLEGKKLVRRERPSDNRRQVLCFITKPGLDLLHKLDTPVRNKVNQALHQLDESEIEELIRLLELARGEQPSTTYVPAASSQ
jgi:DNA-binding MarR family transcriptional regulator